MVRMATKRLLGALCAVYALLLLGVAAQRDTRSGGGGGGSRQNPARVPKDSFKSLYFKDGHKTMSRRNKQMPQLKCVGNSKHICDTYAPDIAFCRHLGDGAWKCEADLHHSVRFGQVDVSCEGWEGPGDEYVMRGSCMLQYTLLPSYPESKYTSGLSGFSKKLPSGFDWELGLFYLVIAAIFFYFWRKGRAEQQAVTRRTGRRPGGGGGGGGGDGGNDPPPPYVPYPKQEPGTSTSDNTSGQSSSAWRPGFWTGLAGGALASEAARYMRGSGDNNARYTAQPNRRGFFARSDDYDDDDASTSFERGGLFGGGRGTRGGGGSNAFGAAGPSGLRRSGSPGETRRAFGYGGSSVR